MRRKVPFKWLWTKLIAAWKTTFPLGVGLVIGSIACLRHPFLDGRENVVFFD
jgi:hypothetical protein